MFRPAFLAAAIALGLASAGGARAELLIAPTRVVLEEGERSSELVLVNRSDEEAAYRISVENRRMMKNGRLEAAPEPLPQERFAADMVRFAPKRLIMEPGARQTVRISVSTAGLEPGEYRTHLRVMAAPTNAGRTLAEAAGTGEEDGISIELIAIRSLTIPVIIRKGDLSAKVVLDGAEWSDAESGRPVLVARMRRQGDSSAYGDLQIFVEDEAEPVFMARGVAIYTPNEERDVILPLPEEIADRLRGKALRLAYVAPRAQGGGLLAETALRLD